MTANVQGKRVGAAADYVEFLQLAGGIEAPLSRRFRDALVRLKQAALQ